MQWPRDEVGYWPVRFAVVTDNPTHRNAWFVVTIRMFSMAVRFWRSSNSLDESVEHAKVYVL